MFMEEEIRQRLKQCGLKQNFIAAKLGITPNYLSMCVTGLRKLSKEKAKQLEEIL